MNNTRVEFLLLKYLNVSLSLCGLKGAIKATIPERRESKAKQSKAKQSKAKQSKAKQNGYSRDLGTFQTAEVHFQE